MTRRAVVGGGLAAAALGMVQAACSPAKPAAAPGPGPAAAPGAGAVAAPTAKPAPKRILILGGTGFLGPKTVAAALARGHTVTIFNRGKREKQLPLEFAVEHLYGNRDPNLPADDERGSDGKLLHPEASPKGLEQLNGRTWDVVIDNSGQYPRMVGASSRLLGAHASRYIYISSISAYAENPAAGGDEATRLAVLSDPAVETMGPNFENYGGLKAACERAAATGFAGRTAVVRPGYIVGPGDPTDRFTYWPVRIAQGGEILAPGSPDDPVQWIDVRDLAEWLVTLAENETTGTFNAVGPAGPARWGDVLNACVEGASAAGPAGKTAKLTWVPADWLEHHEMGGEDAFPIWIAPRGEYAGFHRWHHERAIAAGLRYRPIRDTVRALLAWYPGEVERRVRVTRELEAAGKVKPGGPDPSALRAGPTRERELALLATWNAR